MAEVSVIIPVYNVEQYLESCLESVVNQTFTDLEIILVDDGSTDSSSAICDSYKEKDPRIKVIHKKNGGLSSARNAGIEASTSKWFTFVDSDDICELTLAEKLYEAVENNNTKMSAALLGYISDDETERTIKKHEPIDSLFGSSKMITDFLGHGEFGDSLFVWVCGKLYNYEFFGDMRFREGVIYEDEYFASEIYLRDFNIVFVDEALYWYRQRPGSIIHSEFAEKNCIITDILQKRVELYLENGYVKEALRTAHEGCDVHLEKYLKAKKEGHPEWITKYDKKFRYMKKVCRKSAPLKSRMRYFIYSISPALYGLYAKFRGA